MEDIIIKILKKWDGYYDGIYALMDEIFEETEEFPDLQEVHETLHKLVKDEILVISSVFKEDLKLNGKGYFINKKKGE